MLPEQRLPGPYQLSACEDHVSESPTTVPQSSHTAVLVFAAAQQNLFKASVGPAVLAYNQPPQQSPESSGSCFWAALAIRMWRADRRG
jgi:hypothetical protein